MEPILVALIDDEAGLDTVRIVPDLQADRELRIVNYSDPDVFLRELTLGKVNATAALLDIDFSRLNCERLRFSDGSSSNKQVWGFEILDTIKRIDPDFPVVMLTSAVATDQAYRSGRLGADGFISKREIASPPVRLLHTIQNAIDSCEARSLYDHDHLKTAGEFAACYDADERSKVATTAYYHYETNQIYSVIRRLRESVNSGRRIRVLDLGCGTGRIEESLCQFDLRGEIDLVAVDFSGEMINQAFEKLQSRSEACRVHLGYQGDSESGLLNVSLFRATAERLAFLHDESAPSGFDFVILGFGFLSYVNYREVLISSTRTGGFRGLSDLIRPGGKLLFSVYNENSVIYDRVSKYQSDQHQMPIAAIMNPATGYLQVGETRFIACEPFEMDRILRLLRQCGLSVDREEISTFPTLHLMINQSDCEQFADHPLFPPGRWDCNLYQLDERLSRVMPGRGHYIVGLASRPQRTSPQV